MKNMDKYEVRKTVRFELKSEHISKNDIKVRSYIDLKSIYDKVETLTNIHNDFINNLGVSLINPNEKIIQENQGSNRIKGLDRIVTEFGFNDNDGVDNIFFEYETGSLVRFKYQGIEKVFKSDWIENKKDITLQKDKDGNFKRDESGKYKRKNKNYMTLNDLGDNNFLKNFFIKWFDDNVEINRELDNFVYRENDLSRISDLSYMIGKLNSRDYLQKLYILFEGGYINHKNDDGIIEELSKQLSNIKDIIKELLELTKPVSSYGYQVEQITLNYFTRNKTSKDYDDEILLKEENLDKPYDGDLGELYGIDKNQSIECLYKEMKKFKARDKSAFMELLQGNTGYQNISKPFNYKDFEGNIISNYEIKLFLNILNGKDHKTGQSLSSEEMYDKLVSITNQIEKTTDKNLRTSLKQKRGKWYFMNKKVLPNYVNFCDDYKKVAVEYGKRKAEVLSLKREKIEANKDRSWGFITKNDKNDYFVNTINCNTGTIYKKLKNGSIEDDNGNYSYFLFNSITLRAFDKLCFKKGSIFARDVIDEIDKKFTNTFTNNDKTERVIIKSKTELDEDGLLVEFYNEVLNKQNTLNLMYRDGNNSVSILKNSESVVDFEINLKLECYILKEYKAKKESFRSILSGCNIYKITSADIRNSKKNQNKFTKYWDKFWDTKNSYNKFPIRINPEMTISFVLKDNDFIKNTKYEYNRRNKDRYLLATSFSFNADNSYIDPGFIEEEARIKNISDFNKKFNKLNKLEYFYGIDKGTNELITLGIYKGGKNGKIESVILSGKVDIYKITDSGLFKSKMIPKKEPKKGEESNTKHFLYKNSSIFIDEFLDDCNIFKKQDVISCIGNLTSAKVIKGNIILNGDINTIQKLYEINAKRWIYKLILEQGSKDQEVVFNKDTNEFKFGDKTIYYYNDNVNKIVKSDNIKEVLDEYVKLIINYDPSNDKLEDISINKINNLKKAIVSNIVGVIMKLQEYFPGYIVYENLQSSTSNSDLEKQNTFLGNLINDKLYKKLQFKNEVPPILKKFRLDLDEKTIIQHGKVIYVNKSNTSKACPNCNSSLLMTNNGKIVDKQDINKLYGHLTQYENSMHHARSDIDYTKEFLGNNKKIREAKKEAKKSINPNCDYHMKDKKHGFDFIRSGDDIATYNIAKKGKEYIEFLNNK